MPDPITITLIISAAVAILSFWPHIVSFLSERIIPWIRERVSHQAGEVIADLLTYADQGSTAVRRSVRELWRRFRGVVVSSEMKVERSDASTAIARTTTVVRDEAGELWKGTEERVVDWSEIPTAIRSEFIRQNTKVGSLDLVAAVEAKVRERAEMEGMTLTN
ncbi:MAG: hypothetical protein ABMA26_21195 [Limisphaerales bacterium]